MKRSPFNDSFHFDVPNNPDYFTPRRLLDRHLWPTLLHFFANRILIGPESPRHRFIDENYRWRLLCICVGKQSALQQGNSHCFDVFRADGIERGIRKLGALRYGLISNDKYRSPARSARRQRVWERGGLGTRNGLDRGYCVALKRFVFGGRKIVESKQEPHRQEV